MSPGHGPSASPARVPAAMTTRSDTIQAALDWFDAGHFLTELSRRVARRTESQRADAHDELLGYLEDEIGPALSGLGFAWRLLDNPSGGIPFLYAERHEGPNRQTILTYGHGDVVLGYDAQWRNGLSPWTVVVEGDRWYGRGTADNKGQHSLNLAALAQVLAARGSLGFNVKVLLEMGEETGSPGLRALCERERATFAADVLIASDGPRLAARPADAVPRLARRVQLRPSGGPPRRRASLGQLGRAAREPRNDPRERDRLDRRRARTHSGRGAAAAADPGRGPRGAGRHRAGRTRRPGNRPRLGRAGTHRRRARIRLERARGAGVPDRQSRTSGERDPAAGERASAGPLRRRLRSHDLHPCAARAPGPAGPGSGPHRGCAIRGDARDAARSRPSVGAASRRVDRAHDGSAPGDPAQSRGIPAQRLLRRGAGPADRVDPALVSGLLRSMRRTSTCWARSHARGSRS